MKKLIAPSILSANFSKLGDEVRAVEAAGCDWIHVDVMDGHFVPNITIGPLVVEALRQVTKLPIDVHLMIENPDKFIPDFIKAGANWVSVHVEEGYHLDRSLNLIRDLGAHPSIAINPATPLSAIRSVLSLCDMVLLMTVNPGFGGQKFISYCKDKIIELKKEITSKKLSTLIEIDGGVNTNNIGDLSGLGVDVFVAGSAIFGSASYKKTIEEMKKSIG
ncbi:MAG: ribulose-phosphate 3-epimerase [Deltaproteobacteria bacterium RIFCSPLOWO2_12_FULL_40_28]|nr:MAG: ribulose-phosphate 3-epimerase [Deltaproteobacteria bacterium RIFCSPHIGHO2_02_FULL_40_28]OGQ19108.1 MAG: ribulose-phosphate 3-epimerase [Deltaproteobacteria bacterium RIFCSPHIGHO2_12_FULL_40_32]OGQ40280.1 MAG: ribulose-phosphate 3-epimerase [Deltaproteobacteria bacterium RIFCSPLOWO2_02_FULL_40_36]OGQ53551.1 MAG: ribulose-phosphate 3-epimerase [Deltaproteobacteria bacterium RIFCSPLOWO2_12_FULL_40_28]